MPLLKLAQLWCAFQPMWIAHIIWLVTGACRAPWGSKTFALWRLATAAMELATAVDTPRLALGHMIMPMKSAPAAAANSASSGQTTPQTLMTVPARVLALPDASCLDVVAEQ